MHLTTVLHRILPALAYVSVLTVALPTDHIPRGNMVSREFTAPDGNPTAVYVNLDLEFARAPKGTAFTRLSRRTVPFTPGDSSNDDYCSETDPTEAFGNDAPLAADCTAIKNYMETIDGYYTVSPSDFNPSTGWATIISSGTCSFAIKFQVAKDTNTVVVGTNDVHFYVQGYVGDAQNGRIKAVGTISCNNNFELLFLYWGMIHT